jgi:hypothetical protein
VKRLEQATAARLQNLVHGFKALFSAVIRVRHIGVFRFRIELTHEPDLGMPMRPGPGPQLSEVTSVHGENQVETVEVGIDHGTGQGVDAQAVLPAHTTGPGVSRLALVIAMCARGVDDEVLPDARGLRERGKESLREGRAADVAGTDKKEMHRF